MATEPLSALRHGLGLAGPRGAAAGLRGGRAGGGPVGALPVALSERCRSPWLFSFPLGRTPPGSPGPGDPPCVGVGRRVRPCRPPDRAGPFSFLSLPPLLPRKVLLSAFIFLMQTFSLTSVLAVACPPIRKSVLCRSTGTFEFELFTS